LETQVESLKNFNMAEMAEITTRSINKIETLNNGTRDGGLWWLKRKSTIDKITQLMKIMECSKGNATNVLSGLGNIQKELEGLSGGNGPETPGGEDDAKSPAKPSGGKGGDKDSGLPGGGNGPATPGGEDDGKSPAKPSGEDGKKTGISVTGEKIVVQFVGPKGTEIVTRKGGDLQLPQGVSDYMVKRLNKSTIGYDAMAKMHEEFIENQLQDKFILYDENSKPMPTYDREEQKQSWDDEPEDIFVIKNTDEDVLGLCVAYSFSVACQPSQFQDFLSKTGLKKTFYIDKWFARPGNGMPLLKTVIETQTFMCDRVMATTLQKNSAAMCKFLFMPDTPFNFCFHRNLEQLIALAQLNSEQSTPAFIENEKYIFNIGNSKKYFTLAQNVLFQLASTMTPANNDTTLEYVLESSDITDHSLQKKFEEFDKFAAWCNQISKINEPLANNTTVMTKIDDSIEYLDDCKENMALDLNALLTKQRIDFLTKVIRQIEYAFVFLKAKPRNEANEQKLKSLQKQVIEQMKTQYDLVLRPDKDEFLEAEIAAMVATLKNEGILDNDKSNWFERWKELKKYVDDKISTTSTPPKANSWAAGVASGVASGVAGVIKMLPKRDKAAEKPEPEKPEPEKPAAVELKTERYYDKAPKEDGSLEQDKKYVSLEIRVDAHVVEKTAVQEAITSAINQMKADAPRTKITCLYVRISTGNAAMIRTMIGEKFHTVDDPNVPFRVSTCPAWMVNYQVLWDANVKYYDACREVNDDEKSLVTNTLNENKSLVEGLADMNNVLPKEDTKTFIWLQCPASKEHALDTAEEKNILVYLDRLTAFEKTWKFSGNRKKNFVVSIDKKVAKGRRTPSIEFEGKVATNIQKQSLQRVQGEVRAVFLQEFQRASEQEGEGRKKMYIKDIIDALLK